MGMKVSLRALTVLKYAMIGFMLGAIPAVVAVMPPRQAHNRAELISTILGGTLAGAAALAAFGTRRAQTIPVERPSKFGPVGFTLACLPFVVAVLLLAVLAVL
ncbi:MAG: hypothetical protein PW843_15770 [Azospirillaceae bacterium]|nr:hypothetical protein [Azospirillaceae bacterium]